MTRSTLDLLSSLKTELRFLESGGYAKAAESMMRAPQMFEDSPSCPNFENPFAQHACSECALVAIVPPQHRAGSAPCRKIVLGRNGETIDSVVETRGQAQAEQELMAWLRSTIQRIEHARIASMPWFPKRDGGNADIPGVKFSGRGHAFRNHRSAAPSNILRMVHCIVL